MNNRNDFLYPEKQVKKSYNQRVLELKAKLMEDFSSHKSQYSIEEYINNIRQINIKLYDEAVFVARIYKEENNAYCTLKKVFEDCGFQYNKFKKNIPELTQKDVEALKKKKGNLYAERVLKQVRDLEENYRQRAPYDDLCYYLEYPPDNYYSDNYYNQESSVKYAIDEYESSKTL